MLKYPQIDPVIFQLGPIAPRWYGLMWLLGFLFVHRRLRKYWRWLNLPTAETSDTVLGWLVFGTILGARLVYVFFYNLEGTLEGPWWEIFAVWHGGLAFHGGLVGMLIAGLYVTRRFRIPWLRLCDVVATAAPVGLGLGRIANFINGELWGRATDLPWAMIFPGAGLEARHPSQLYEFLLEGVLLYALVNFVWSRRPRVAVTGGVFLSAYALMRFLVEFVREPDVQVGFLFDFFTMGQLLSLSMLAGGLYVLWYGLTRGEIAPDHRLKS